MHRFATEEKQKDKDYAVFGFNLVLYSLLFCRYVIKYVAIYEVVKTDGPHSLRCYLYIYSRLIFTLLKQTSKISCLVCEHYFVAKEYFSFVFNVRKQRVLTLPIVYINF